jgi:hypothetical protein
MVHLQRTTEEMIAKIDTLYTTLQTAHWGMERKAFCIEKEMESLSEAVDKRLGRISPTEGSLLRYVQCVGLDELKGIRDEC